MRNPVKLAAKFAARFMIVFLALAAQLACAASQEIDDHHWTGVARIVAVGDIHGDYDHYLQVLQAAGLVNAKGKWTGGATHLVQTGDIPDRGPDTVKIIRHLGKLAKEAKKKGGRVHALIGNHEVMNVYGDLRYVSDGEYAAFTNGKSSGLRDRYFELSMQDLQKRSPESFMALPENYRETWDKDHPLGWVEHRQAWDPAWNPKAEFAQWVLGNKVSIQVNDLVFLHAGISGFYCQNSLQSLTQKVVTSLTKFDPANPGIVEDEFGPLWYRGLAGESPEAAPETVQAILDHHSAKHIVVGHTPTNGAIWPRYDGRVIQIDTGISKAYGGQMAYLEVTPEGMFAGYPGGKVPLPMAGGTEQAYLEQVIALNPENGKLKKQLEVLLAPPAPATEVAVVDATAAGSETVADTATENQPAGSPPAETGAAAPAAPPVVIPTCGISE